MGFFGISAGFDSFSSEGKELIIQYQAKYEKDVECGGGYLKIGPKQDDLSAFGDPTAYNIMFGPDKCGYTKRTHLFRLTVKPDTTVRVDIDEEKIYDGSLKEDWEL